MSKARLLADQTWEKGAAERRDWNPEANSAHYRVYKWWMKRSGKRPTRENFCHYWRVVLIWAPLHWLVKPLLVVLGLAVLALVVWLVVAFPTVTPWFLAGMATAVYIVFGCFVGKQLMSDLDLGDVYPVDWLESKPDAIRSLAVLLFSPVLIVGAALALSLGTIVGIFIILEDDYKAFSKFWNWFTSAHFSHPAWLKWMHPWHAIPAGFLVFCAVPSAAQPVGLVLLVVVVGFGAFIGLAAGIIVALSYVTDKVKERNRVAREKVRRQARKEEVDTLLLIMFEVLHPNWVRNEERFAEWRARYVDYWGGDEYAISYWTHLGRLTSRQQGQVEYIIRQRSVRNDTRQPSRFSLAIGSTFRNIGDYLSLIWSVVLTKKWKICPWVELPD